MATVSGGGDVPTVESSDGEQVSRTVAAQIQQQWSFSSLSAPPLDQTRVRNVGGVVGGCDEPRTECPSPHLLLYGIVRQGPTNHGSVGRPLSGHRSRPRLGRWTESIGDQPDILSLDLTFQLKLKILYLFPLHRRLVQRACLITTVSTIRLTATIHVSILKQILS
jgi:hypothetical protein